MGIGAGFTVYDHAENQIAVSKVGDIRGEPRDPGWVRESGYAILPDPGIDDLVEREEIDAEEVLRKRGPGTGDCGVGARTCDGLRPYLLGTGSGIAAAAEKREGR